MTYILGQKSAAASSDYGTNVTSATFNKDVVEASLKQPIVVLFTMARDPSCQKFDAQLTALMKDYANTVGFARADVSDPALAMLLQRFGMQGVPAVFVLHGGQMLDGFAGMLPDRELRTFFQTLLGAPQRSLAQVYADAVMAFDAADYAAAADGCALLLQETPSDLKALALLAECHMCIGDLAQGEALLQSANVQNHADTARARTRLAFLRTLENLPNTTTNAVEQALLLVRAGNNAAAIDALLALLKDAAHKPAALSTLHQLFAVLGHDAPLSVQGRKRLTQLLF